jgi:hypothetical protein
MAPADHGLTPGLGGVMAGLQAVERPCPEGPCRFPSGPRTPENVEQELQIRLFGVADVIRLEAFLLEGCIGAEPDEA